MKHKTLYENILYIQHWVKLFNKYPSMPEVGNNFKVGKRFGTPNYKNIKKQFGLSWDEFVKKAGYTKSYFRKLKPKKCDWCNKVTFVDSSEEFRDQKFCSTSCGARWRNKNLDRTKSEETKDRISKSLKKTHLAKPKKPKQASLKIKPKKPKNPTIKKSKLCLYCFKHNVRINSDYCSVSCGQGARSSKAINRMIEKGTNNISSRVKGFGYKHIQNIDCDSKLEAAGIIYLVDYLKATRIDRFRGILNFKDKDGKNHKFNPDFLVEIEGKTTLVEVKQVYKESFKGNLYSRFFGEKKRAMLNFCEKHSYDMIWLDFNFDKKFQQIYKQFLKRTVPEWSKGAG